MATYRITICDKGGTPKKKQSMQIHSSLTPNEIVSEIQMKHDQIAALGYTSYGTVKIKDVDLAETYFFDSFACLLPDISKIWEEMASVLPFMNEEKPIEVKV